MKSLSLSLSNSRFSLSRSLTFHSISCSSLLLYSSDISNDYVDNEEWVYDVDLWGVRKEEEVEEEKKNETIKYWASCLEKFLKWMTFCLILSIRYQFLVYAEKMSLSRVESQKTSLKYDFLSFSTLYYVSLSLSPFFFMPFLYQRLSHFI